jgi:ketosteroid isomerase-like protein
VDLTSASAWVERLRGAWVEGDSEAAASLFTADAVYRSHPFRTPLQGRTDIAGYWSVSTATQSDLRVRFGEPLVDGDRVAVEWWANVTEAGRPQTDCGALILRFDDDLCSELREYWNLTDSALEPPPGWGL